MSRPRPTEAEVAVRALTDLTLRPLSDRRRRWREGAIPRQGCLVADGFGSRSLPEEGYLPWLPVLRPILRTTDPYILACGFSYSVPPGSHYSPFDTNISLLGQAETLVAPYTPPAGVPFTYLTFSLAGALFALGLEAWLRSRPPTDLVPIKSLLLVQPALVLSQDVATAVSNARRRSAPLFELGTPSLGIQELVVDALGALAARLPQRAVQLWYWPGDGFIVYPEALIARLEAVDVVCRSFDLSFAPPFPRPIRTSFHRHAAVAHHPTILTELGELVSRTV